CLALWLWLGASCLLFGSRARVRGPPSQKTLLRHVRVALGLRHPWLRTFLGGRSPNPLREQLTEPSCVGICTVVCERVGGEGFPKVLRARDGPKQAPREGLSVFWKAFPTNVRPAQSRIKAGAKLQTS